MRMKFGLTRAGLGDVGPDETLIELAAAYGYCTVDTDAASLAGRLGTENARALLERHRIELSSIGLRVNWREDDAAFRASLHTLPHAAQAASDLGCRACCTYILPSTDSGPARFMALAIRRLRLCADILDAFGMRLGLEYVGPHHLRSRWKYPFIWTQEETLDMIGAIGRPNVGLMLDSYHWHTTGLSAEAIAALQPHQIVHVHLNDAPDVPIEQAIDNERLYPGEGVIDLPKFLQAVHSTGYRGAVTQEVLLPAAPAEDVHTILRRSKSGLDRVLQATAAAMRETETNA